MFKKPIVAIVIGIFIFSLSQAMPPHPNLLEKIRNGEVAVPLFMANPDYSREVGINQGLVEPLFTPGVRTTNWNTLAVLVEFPDQFGTVLEEDFDSLIFGQTYYVGPSLKEFYDRASYGNLDIITVNYPSVYGWHGLPQNRNYYTAAGGSNSYGMGTYPNNSQGLCEDLLNIIDPLVNFANYDNNGDSYVDGIIIIHSGRGAELSGDTLDIWSHKWEITPQWRDGVYIKNYCVDPEYRYISGDATVGVFAHEFGHILGLPDLYDYDVPFDSYGLGYWSLMAYGGWNGNMGAPDTLAGSSPAFLDAWSRVKLGFVSPTNIPCFVQNIHIPAVEDSAKVYRLWTNGDDTSLEYYLVENRFSSFTDTALAGHGLLIYHIDENQIDNNNQWWPGQPPANHYMVALEQADNNFDLEHAVNGMDWSDPFRQGHNNTFDYSSSPSSRDYYGNNTNVSLTYISNTQYVMLADMDVGAMSSPDTPSLLWPEDGYCTSYQVVTLTCEYMLCTSQYHIQIDDDPSFASPLFDDNSLAYNYVQYSFHGEPDGLYYWRARAGNTAGWSDWSETWSFMMDRVAPDNSIASSPDTSHSSSFTVTWSAGYDPPPSCGICSYLIYADSGTGWYIWLVEVDSLSAVYTGAVDSRTYYFQARARDCALNIETQDPPWQPECSTYVSIIGYQYLPGDANMYNGIWPPQCIGSDVTYLVNYFRGVGDACELDGLWCSADANGDCNIIGSDVTRLVNYFRGNTTLLYCPDYEPVWLTPDDLPDSAPSGWPNCGTPVINSKIIPTGLAE